MPSNGAAAGLQRHAEVPGRSALAGPHPLLRVLSRRQTVPASAPAIRPDGPASSRGSCTCSRPGLRSRARREREGAWALVLTLAAAAAFCLAVWLLAHGRRWLRQRLDTYLTRRLRIWEEERTTLARVIRTFGHFVFLGFVLVIAEECLRFVFRLFPYTRPWSEKLTGYAVVIAEQVAGAAVEAAPDLVMVALIAALAQFASKILAATAHG